MNEAEELLNSHEILEALAYARLHYISVGKLEKAEKNKVLLNKIVNYFQKTIPPL